MKRTAGQEFSLERIERMLLIAADLVDRRGPIAQPLLDRMEREYRAALERGTAVDRIRKMIEARNVAS